MGTSNLDDLKMEAFEINMGIVRERLVVLTWGNASSFDRANGIFAIKPSGVSYSLLKWQDMVLVDLDANVIDSKLKPSSDTLTHLEIYKGFSAVGGIVHTHSPWATIWAQACKSIPVLGTTHSDHFNGDVPCIPYLNKAKVESAYEIPNAIFFPVKLSLRTTESSPKCALSRMVTMAPRNVIQMNKNRDSSSELIMPSLKP